MKEFYRAYKIEPERIYKLQQQENKKKFTYVNSKISHNQGKPQLKRLITEVEVCKWKVKKVQIYYPEITAEKVLKLEEFLKKTLEHFRLSSSNELSEWRYTGSIRIIEGMIQKGTMHENRETALTNLLTKIKDHIDLNKVKEIVEETDAK